MINFKTCTEEELWKYVASHLESKGLEVVLVGGAVVSIYSKGIYKSGDLDFIVTSLFKEKLPQYMKEIGFEKGTKGSLGRLYRHPECNHLVVEFPTGPSKERKTLEQAVLVAKAQPYNIERIKKWCENEGSPEIFELFINELKK